MNHDRVSRDAAVVNIFQAKLVIGRQAPSKYQHFSPIVLGVIHRHSHLWHIAHSHLGRTLKHVHLMTFQISFDEVGEVDTGCVALSPPTNRSASNCVSNAYG